MSRRVTSLRIAAAWIQGLYFTIFGIWPLLDIASFQAVTGPKTDHLVTGRESDHWLVYTVAGLITAIGMTLLVAAFWRRVTVEMIVLGLLSAGVLSLIDLVYVSRGVIAPIYLGDAIVEAILIAMWSVASLGLFWETNHC
jgi:hypothetical protein